jgi:peptidoglycan/xylan/chitin deacetylase (PgdA/CDA1 family)
VLVECGAPATLFLTGASLDGPRRFWWELVQEAFDRGLSLDDVVASTSAGPASIHDLAERIKRMPPEQRREADVALRRLVGEAPEGGLQRDQVAALGADLAVGFHTRDHDFLPSVPEQDVGHAVGAGVDAVQAAVRTPVTLFAYPHGGSDKSIAAAVRAQGFTQAFTTRAEAVTPRSDPLLLGRWEPPTGISRAGFGFALVRLLYAAR